MPVDVQYPVPVSHVPRRARSPRLSFVAERVPVDLVRVRPGEIEPLSIPAAARDAFDRDEADRLGLHGGEAWLRLPGCAPDPGMRPAHFEAFLAGERDWDSDPVFNILRMHCMRSPIVAQRIVEGGSVNRLYDDFARGADFDPAAQRRIVADGRGVGGERVAAYLREEFRIEEAAVWMRYRPALNAGVAKDRLRISHQPYLSIGSLPPANPWKADAAIEAWGRSPPGRAAVDAALEVLPGRGDDVHDLLRLASWLAANTRARVTADAGMYRRFHREASDRRLAAACERLAPYEVDGMTGVVSADDAGRVLAAAADAWDAYAEGLMQATHLTGEREAIGRWSRWAIRERLDAAPLADEDARALDGLSLSA